MGNFCTKIIAWFSTIRVFTTIHSYLFSKSSSKKLNYSPPKFYIAPEEWRLESDPLLLGRPIFRAYVKLRWCITQKEVTPMTPLKTSMDTQNSHIWKEMHLKQPSIFDIYARLRGDKSSKKHIPKKFKHVACTQAAVIFRWDNQLLFFFCPPSWKKTRKSTQNGSSPPKLGKRHIHYMFKQLSTTIPKTNPCILYIHLHILKNQPNVSKHTMDPKDIYMDPMVFVSWNP